MGTFQDRMDEVIERCGGKKRGQSELARRLKTTYNIDVKPQTFSYLASRTRKKPARSSRYTAEMATVVGLRPEWLATGTGEKDAHTVARGYQPAYPFPLESSKLVGNVELTKAAIELVKAWMDLPRNQRDHFKRQIETEALQYTSTVPDSYGPSTEATTAPPPKRKG